MTYREALRYLGLEEDKEYNDKDIKTAYRKQAKKYHPDSSKEQDSDMFIKCAEAFELLRGNRGNATYCSELGRKVTHKDIFNVKVN